MKKTSIKILITLLVFYAFSFAVFNHEKESGGEHIHVHELQAATDYGNCPTCGSPMDLVSGSDVAASCTQDGGYLVHCITMGCYEQMNGITHFVVTTKAYGHDYQLIENNEATCTKDGSKLYRCSRCQDEKKEKIEALGHNYKYQVIKEATCTEEGTRKYTCTRCGNTYNKTIDALGHDIEYEEAEPTCTKDGYKKGTCKRCGEEFNEVYPALGHKLGEFTVIKEPTCTEDGKKKATCSVCNEDVIEAIPKLGHKFPEEWTIEKEAGYFSEGLKTKTCSVCKEKISEIIPKIDATPVYAAGGAIVLAGAAIIAFFKINGKPFKKVKNRKINRKSLEPEFEDKSVLVSSYDEKFIETLKNNKHLKVTACIFDEIKDKAKEDGPDLIIAEIKDDDEYENILKLKEEELSELNLGLILTQVVYDKNKEQLNKLREDRKIVDYVCLGTDNNVAIVKLVLPVLKPKLNSDESLGNIGMVADALGIPAVSKIIDVYVSGRDIKETLKEEEKGVSEIATIIGDIASILGLDTVASVAGLVDDVDSIRSALDKESGANEKSAGIDGAKDIVDVVSDIVSKD